MRVTLMVSEKTVIVPESYSNGGVCECMGDSNTWFVMV
jgi:hypothetical protein